VKGLHHALIESIFSSVKRNLPVRALESSQRMQVRQALVLGSAFNLYRPRNRYVFLRMSTAPSYFKEAPFYKALMRASGF
jgi:hypothetical protein